MRCFSFPYHKPIIHIRIHIFYRYPQSRDMFVTPTSASLIACSCIGNRALHRCGCCCSANARTKQYNGSRRTGGRAGDAWISVCLILCMRLCVYERKGDRGDIGKEREECCWPIPYRPLIVVQRKEDLFIINENEFVIFFASKHMGHMGKSASTTGVSILPSFLLPLRTSLLVCIAGVSSLLPLFPFQGTHFSNPSLTHPLIASPCSFFLPPV